MNTRFDTDPELLDLVRTADPMLDTRVQANAGLDTESALRLIMLELNRPPAPPRGQRRRRTALRTAMLASAVAAVVLVLANVIPTGNNSAVSPAQAQTILRHVRAALLFPLHAIYEQQEIGTVTARDGATFTSASHEWLSTSPPYNNRLIMIWNGQVQWEQAFVNLRLDLYDPATNTVYLAPGVARNQVSDTPQSTSALSEVQDLLRQPRGVTVNPHAALDAAPAIKLTFVGGRFSYWISPTNYQPLQSEDRQDSLPNGQGGVGISRYPIVRVLTGAAASPSLLSLQAQHPHATVDHSRTDYTAALSRMHHEAPSMTAAIKRPHWRPGLFELLQRRRASETAVRPMRAHQRKSTRTALNLEQQESNTDRPYFTPLSAEHPTVSAGSCPMLLMGRDGCIRNDQARDEPPRVF